MRKADIENWVLRVVEQVKAGKPFEDSRVEIKSEWIQKEKAGRRLAAHANAAHGESILWIVGIDQDKGVVGASYQETADWLSGVASQFDEIVPAVTDINVVIDGKTVVALLFETDRSPYVVRNPAFGTSQGGPIEWEVPFREASSTRTARRSDLLRILAPLQMLPEMEFLTADLSVREQKEDKKGLPLHWYFSMHLYCIPNSTEMLVIPFHRCQARVRFPGTKCRFPLGFVQIEPPTTYSIRSGASQITRHSLTAESTRSETVITGPSKLILRAECHTLAFDIGKVDKAEVVCILRVAGQEKAIRLEITMEQFPKESDAVKGYKAKWYANPPRQEDLSSSFDGLV